MYCRLSYSALIFVHDTLWLGSTGASITNNANDSNDISLCQTPSLSHSVKSEISYESFVLFVIELEFLE